MEDTEPPCGRQKEPKVGELYSFGVVVFCPNKNLVRIGNEVKLTHKLVKHKTSFVYSVAVEELFMTENEVYLLF